MAIQITPTTRQKRFFTVAQKQSMQSTYARHKGNRGNGKICIGSAIVKGNYVVAKGVNKIKTHTRQLIHNKKHLFIAPAPRIHAEIDALIASRFNDLTGCEVFVYREMADGTLANCRPCPACMGAMIEAGIKHIYYTTEQGYFYERI